MILQHKLPWHIPLIFALTFVIHYLELMFSAGIVGTLLIAWLGDILKRRVLLSSVGFALAALVLYQAILAQSLTTMVALFALAVFCQSAFQAQEHATVQKLAIVAAAALAALAMGALSWRMREMGQRETRP